jgi:hypothetical protein
LVLETGKKAAQSRERGQPPIARGRHAQDNPHDRAKGQRDDTPEDDLEGTGSVSEQRRRADQISFLVSGFEPALIETILPRRRDGDILVRTIPRRKRGGRSSVVL